MNKKLPSAEHVSPFDVLKRYQLRRRRKYHKKLHEKWSSIIVEDPVVKVDEFQGVFSVGVQSDLFKRLLFNSGYEPDLVELCLEYLDPTRDVLDVGANIGFFTVLFAKNIRGGKVLSVEPTPNALKRLYRNLELNAVQDSVIVFEGVASNQEDTIEIKSAVGKEEYSTIGNASHPTASNLEFTSRMVQSKTIDQLVNEFRLNPGFIKIDTEGAENLVFSGAQATLQNNRPIIISELSDYLLRRNGASAQQVIDVITRSNYKIYDTDGNASPTIENFGEIICVPFEYLG